MNKYIKTFICLFIIFLIYEFTISYKISNIFLKFIIMFL